MLRIVFSVITCTHWVLSNLEVTLNSSYNQQQQTDRLKVSLLAVFM